MVVLEKAIYGLRARVITLQIPRYPWFGRHFGYKSLIYIKRFGSVMRNRFIVFVFATPGRLPAPPVLVLVPVAQEPIQQPGPEKFNTVDMVIIIPVQLAKHISCRYRAVAGLALLQQANLAGKVLFIIAKLCIGSNPADDGAGVLYLNGIRKYTR